MLRQIRDRHGVSQRALAKAAGITQAALFRLESGETDPRLGTLRKLAEALGVTVAGIIGEGRPARKRAKVLRSRHLGGHQGEIVASRPSRRTPTR